MEEVAGFLGNRYIYIYIVEEGEEVVKKKL
jgi:hypothetical protein